MTPAWPSGRTSTHHTDKQLIGARYGDECLALVPNRMARLGITISGSKSVRKENSRNPYRTAQINDRRFAPFAFLSICMVIVIVCTYRQAFDKNDVTRVERPRPYSRRSDAFALFMQAKVINIRPKSSRAPHLAVHPMLKDDVAARSVEHHQQNEEKT